MQYLINTENKTLRITEMHNHSQVTIWKCIPTVTKSQEVYKGVYSQRKSNILSLQEYKPRSNHLTKTGLKRVLSGGYKALEECNPSAPGKYICI